MYAATLRLWQLMSGDPPRPLPPPAVRRRHVARVARSVQQRLAYWGVGLLVVVVVHWGLLHWRSGADDARLAGLIALQALVVVVSVRLVRGTVAPEHVIRVGGGMLVAMVVCGALYASLLPDPTASFSVLATTYVVSGRLLLGGRIGPQVLVAATCVVVNVAVLVAGGFSLPVLIANTIVAVVVATLLVVRTAVTQRDQLDELYRRHLTHVVLTLARQPISAVDDLVGAVDQLATLAAETLAIDAVDAWVVDDDRQGMRRLGGCTRRGGAPPRTLPLADHPAYLAGLGREPLVQLHPSPAGDTAPRCPHAGPDTGSSLEAAVRVAGGTGGAVCFRRREAQRGWSDDEQRFANHIAHLVALAIEASQRRRAEDAIRTSDQRLRESEERFRQLMTQAADALYVSDEDGRIVEANIEACHALGYTRAELLALHVADLVAAPAEPPYAAVLERLAREPHVSTETWLRRKDGSTFPVETRVSRIDVRGSRHVLTAARDITARHEADAALRQAMRALEQRGAELSDTVAMLNEHIHERQTAERRLRESQDELRTLSLRLLQVQEEEGRRIAREIHDELGQTLTALQLDLAWLARRVGPSSAAVQQKLERMDALVDATLASVHSIARILRPPLLDDLGLAAALTWQAREFEQRTGIACRLALEHDDVAVDDQRAITVFRLVQEALTNVARHARATRVTIALRAAHGRLTVTVRDDGRGIDPEAARSRAGLGMLGMRERVHLWGGRLRVDGRQGRGTVVRAEIPLGDGTAPEALDGRG